MLSPSMMTKSKLVALRYASISEATSNCGGSPVPLSPITAKRTDLSSSGKVRLSPLRAGGAVSTAVIDCAPAGEISANTDQTAAAAKILRSGMGARRNRYRVTNEIYNQICLNIAKNQVVIDNPILKIFGKFRQVLEQGGRHGLQRHGMGIGLIDVLRDPAHRFRTPQALMHLFPLTRLKRRADQLAKDASDLR